MILELKVVTQHKHYCYTFDIYTDWSSEQGRSNFLDSGRDKQCSQGDYKHMSLHQTASHEDTFESQLGGKLFFE